MNLVGNAVKFTAQGEVVVARGRRTRRCARARPSRLSVTDTGIGMDAPTIAKIFEPFTQADESTTRRFGGSGLGLAICRELAELMGGSITVESHPQVGSTFQCQPAAARARRSRAAQRAAAAVAAGAHPDAPPGAGRVAGASRAALGLTVLGQMEAATTAELIIVDAGGQQRLPAVTPGGPRRHCRRRSSWSPPPRSWRHPSSRALRPARRRAQARAARAPWTRRWRPRCGVAGAGGGRRAARRGRHRALGGHVLLVEDEPVNAAVAQGYLEALGCTCGVGQGRSGGGGAQRRGTLRSHSDGPEHADHGRLRHHGADPSARGAGRARVPIVALTAHDAVSYRDGLSEGRHGRHAEQALHPGGLRAAAASLAAAGCRARPCGTAGASECRSAASMRRPWPALRQPARAHGHRRSVPEAHRAVPARIGSKHCSTLARAPSRRPDLHAAAALCHKLASSAANVGALAFARELRTARAAVRRRQRRRRPRELHARVRSGLSGADRAELLQPDVCGPAHERRDPTPSRSPSSPTMRTSVGCCSAKRSPQMRPEVAPYDNGSAALAAATGAQSRHRAAGRRHAGPRWLLRYAGGCGPSRVSPTFPSSW